MYHLETSFLYCKTSDGSTALKHNLELLYMSTSIIYYYTATPLQFWERYFSLHLIDNFS